MASRDDDAADAAPRARSLGLLYVGHGPGASLSYFTGAGVDLVVGALIPVPVEGLTIGRRVTAALRVASSQVAPRHAQLSVIDGGVVLEDLRTPNGTSLNGVRLDGPTTIGPNDRITIAGQFDFDVVELG